MKPGLLLNASAVPQVRQITRQGAPVALNRYILDYWQHGQKQALVRYNYLREGDHLFPMSLQHHDHVLSCLFLLRIARVHGKEPSWGITAIAS